MEWEVAVVSTGSRTYLVEAKLTPNLRVGACGEFRAHGGQPSLRRDRVRVRGAEDPPSPGNHVLHDGLGFEQVVACVEIKKTSRAQAVLIQTQVVAGAVWVVGEGRDQILAEPER